jgi:antibiotic biosynthesis monooxygenase (ABM) superfamily enzyme
LLLPFDHWYDKPVPPLAVKVTEPPWQNVVAPLAVIVAVGNGLTVTVRALAVVAQPAAFVIVTVFVDVVLATIEAVVAPLDQR